ncbi:hypothetical protein [Bradyrhizobium sp. Y-H1]|nr:hypothetical protein [Bradyrhizobium sp. Y-H1]
MTVTVMLYPEIMRETGFARRPAHKRTRASLANVSYHRNPAFNVMVSE